MDINEKNFDTIEDLDIIKEEEIDFGNSEEVKVDLLRKSSFFR